MLTTYATGLGAIVLMALGWVAIQSAWRRVFPGVSCDPDVLAGRPDCHGCAGPRHPESIGSGREAGGCVRAGREET